MPLPELKLPEPSSIQPQPLTPVPDNPPPHEGAFFDLPIIVEPPDILVIQVLKTLPGRPVEGEFLVRPDGSISLGYYGKLQVRGLTLDQVKEKVVLHMRRFLRDEALGLIGRRTQEDGSFQLVPIPPKDVDTVFVDMAKYNSKFVYVEGDVGLPGRQHYTGQETVLDALNAAAGFTPTANSNDIVLVRPARAGKPSRTYKIDYKAITRRGDARANLQLFPGDRIIVGRDAIVQATVDIDRRLAPFFSFVNSVQSYATAIRTAQSVLKDLSLDPRQRQAMVKDMVDLLWDVNHRPDGAVLDEKAFKEALSRHLNAVLEASEDGREKAEPSKPKAP